MIIAAVIILQVKSVDYRGGSRYVRSARLGAKVSPAYWRHRR